VRFRLKYSIYDLVSALAQHFYTWELLSRGLDPSFSVSGYRGYARVAPRHAEVAQHLCSIGGNSCLNRFAQRTTNTRMPNYKNEHTNRDFLMSHPSSNHRLNCFVNHIEQLKSMIDPLHPQLFNRGTDKVGNSGQQHDPRTKLSSNSDGNKTWCMIDPPKLLLLCSNCQFNSTSHKIDPPSPLFT
jgi:hypothetical protein